MYGAQISNERSSMCGDRVSNKLRGQNLIDSRTDCVTYTCSKEKQIENLLILFRITHFVQLLSKIKEFLNS